MLEAEFKPRWLSLEIEDALAEIETWPRAWFRVVDEIRIPVEKPDAE